MSGQACARSIPVASKGSRFPSSALEIDPESLPPLTAPPAEYDPTETLRILRLSTPTAKESVTESIASMPESRLRSQNGLFLRTSRSQSPRISSQGSPIPGVPIGRGHRPTSRLRRPGDLQGWIRVGRRRVLDQPSAAKCRPDLSERRLSIALRASGVRGGLQQILEGRPVQVPGGEKKGRHDRPDDEAHGSEHGDAAEGAQQDQ